MSRVRGGSALARWLAPPLALLLAACTAPEAEPVNPADDAASPFAGCGTLSSPPAAAHASASAAGPAPAPASAAGPASGLASGGTASGPLSRGPASGTAPTPADGVAADLPDISLPCFTGGDQVRLVGLRGPAVLNLWGSWCAPCREELPVMQELADATEGRLRVVGVDTMDSRDAGASFAADKGVSFPTLFDPDKKLLSGLGRANLPVTVFIGADGERYVYTGKALDKPTLGGLVRAHTGVTVTE